jgi:hypothetical protein
LNQENAGEVEMVIRRRRTSRHRRNRKIRRTLLGVFCVGLAIGVALVLPSVLSSLHHARSQEPSPETVEASRNILLLTEEESLRQMEQRPVYPYSIVPGGARDASELRWMADHDPVVRSHYAGFDYDHARVEHLEEARLFYVSYRIGSKVYWTRHRIKLRKGEALITDGKIKARSRCGNRVEEAPQEEMAASEPPAFKFDEAVRPSMGTATANPPVPFDSALNRPSVPGLGPAPPLSLYSPLGGGTWIPISPPPLPGLCGVGKTKNTSTGGTKGKGNPCGNGGSGGEVPEPTTWLLVASGLTAMLWKARLGLARS